MEDAVKVIGGVVLTLLVVLVAAVFGGTIVFWLWPHVVPDVLVGAVANGSIPASILWKDAVMFTWLCGLLFKGGSSYNTKSK
jgi:hypothetical protein